MPTAKAVRSNIERSGPRPAQRAQRAQRTSPARYKGGYPGAPTARQVRTGLENAGPHAGTPRVSSSGRPSSPRPGRGGRGSSGRPGQVSIPGVSGSAHTGALIAEFLLAEVFIWWGIFIGKKKFNDAMSSALWQSTAVVMVFFVLALISRGEKTSRAAVAFGAIIDLGIIFAATQNGVIATMGQQITGKGTSVGQDTAVLTAATGSDIAAPEHEGGFGTPAETT